MAAIREWTLKLNLAGVPLFDPGSTFDRIPQGVYAATIVDSEQDAAKTAGACDNVIFTFEITEAGAMKGKRAKIWMPIDPNVGKGIAGRKWKALAYATAKDPSKLEAGAVNLGAKYFQGKTCFLHVQEVPGKDDKGRDLLPNISPIDKAMYDKYKAEGYGATSHTANASNGAAAGTMTVVGGPTTGAPATVPQAAAEITANDLE